VQSDTSDEDRRRTLTLEAFADTFVPGARRSPDDVAIAGAAAGPGAVEAGALELLGTPATGVSEGLTDLAGTLNEHARAYAAERELVPEPAVPPFVVPAFVAPPFVAPPFVALSFADRTAVVRMLIAPGHPEKDIWILVALFCFMAFDTAAHMHTVGALAAGHPGLTAMGFAKPDDDGLWRFPDFSYGRPLADIHPDTTPAGDPA
jgi:hypothetical protein